MPITRIGRRGTVVIPASIRRRFGLKSRVKDESRISLSLADALPLFPAATQFHNASVLRVIGQDPQSSLVAVVMSSSQGAISRDRKFSSADVNL